MKERSFLDTNILLYSDDASAPDKQAQALQVLEQGWNSGNTRAIDLGAAKVFCRGDAQAGRASYHRAAQD